ncbi:MAG: PilX N-terminal domain-containing pilus assembly protein [Blastocatellia bacterium]
MANRLEGDHSNERGIALVTTLLVTTMLLALGMAVVFSATSDTVITRSQRVGEIAFYAADTGVSIARRALETALEEEIARISNGTATYGQNGGPYYYVNTSGTGFPDVYVIPDPDVVPDYQFYTNVYARANQLIANAKADSAFSTTKSINRTDFVATISRLTGSVDPIDRTKTNPFQAIKFRYSIKVTGTTDAGGSSTVNEVGRISVNVTLASTSAPGMGRDFSFSGFGAFFDNGDTTANSALAAGTFSGPVHTNTHFAFQSNRSVAFRDVVSQVDNYIRYDSSDFSQGRISIPNKDMAGIDISSQGYQKTGIVPLPANNFSQEYAVINGTGITDRKLDGTPVDPPAVMPRDLLGNLLPIFDPITGRVTPTALSLNLRDSQNKIPSVSGGKLGGGDAVYIPSGDGATITGAGIYVQGDATDIQLYANGTDQVYAIRQGSKVTTVTVSYANNRTTIADSGGKTSTFTGVPTDKSDPGNPRPGASLFVTGEIKSLRGGYDSTTGKNVSALAPKTALTITAQRDITITGDLKYSNPVLDSQGLPVQNANTVQNVLGIFTNNGNVNLAPNANYDASRGLTLEVNAAIAAFNADPTDDAGGIEGSIVYTGSPAPGSSDKWTLMGSRVQAKINNIGYSNRNIYFDVRFSGGTFRPPFFPGTNYTLGAASTPAVISVTSVSDPKPVGVSWYRENN